MFTATLATSILAFQQNSPLAHQVKLATIANEKIKLGIDLNLGGSITYLAPANRPELNVVNSADWGREIQLSFYSGPVPYQPQGKEVSKAWVGLGWNPIQSGDAFGNTSKVLASRIGIDSLYIKCIPMHWPLNNVPGECEFEIWLKLSGSTVWAHCRLTNKRSDLTQFPARAQELPAVYVNAPYYHLMTYTGVHPYENDALTEIHNRLDLEHRWATWIATENWAAQIDDKGFGLGIWNPGTTRFSGGFFSQPGKGGPSDSPTGYIAPNRTEILDHNIVYDFNYVLILGQLNDIRNYVYQHADPHRLPDWRFKNSREGWSYENATKSGWPIRGGLDFTVGSQRTTLVSPEFATRASDIDEVVMDASLDKAVSEINLNWKYSREDSFNSANSVTVHPIADGKRRTYEFPVSHMLDPQALISQLRIALFNSSGKGGGVRIYRVRFVKKTRRAEIP